MAREQKNVSSKRKKTLILILIIIPTLIIDLTFTGFLKFGYNVARCGGLPTKIVRGAFTGPSTYELPGNYFPGWADSRYLCTEQEAIDKNIPKGLNTKYNEFKNK